MDNRYLYEIKKLFFDIGGNAEESALRISGGNAEK